MPSEEKNFTKILKQHVSSKLFLAGCVLYSVGILLLVIDFSLLTFFLYSSYFFYIAGVWFFYAKKFSAGLKIFKFFTIFWLIIFCIAMGLLIPVTSLFLLIAAVSQQTLGIGALELAVTFFVLMILVATFFLVLKFYFFAALNVLKSIRKGIGGEKIKKIKGVNSFFVMTLLIIFFWSFIDFSLYFLQDEINIFFTELDNFVMGIDSLYNENFVNPGMGASESPVVFHIYQIIFAAVGNAGCFLILLALKKFAAAIANGDE
ncbi:MAG: hypothetical protein FWD19_06335 [Defluviitaleaceae bacterium]|nr:hypothetical protein [Defluviitaleaceae bacterium]